MQFMNENLNTIYAAEQFRQHGYKLVDMLAQYLENVQQKDTKMPVMPYSPPDERLKYWSKIFKDKNNDFFDIIEKTIQQSLHLHHPRYIGHQVCAPIPLAALSSMVAALLNNSQAVYEVGAVSQVMETIVVRSLAKHLGFDENADGILTSGGSLGNLTALLTARQAKSDNKVWESGYEKKQYAFMVSDHSHYSVSRAVKIMGLGENGIIKLPLNKDFSIDVSKVDEIYTKAIGDGKIVLGLVANACSTATGTYDNLTALGEFCKKNNLWFHVDGAHGCSVAYSQKYKHLIKGIQHAHSVVVDYHKMFMFPSLVTAVVFRNSKHAYQTFAQQATYLLDGEEQWFDSAKRTVECTKLMLALPVYAVIGKYTEKIFTEYTESRIEEAARFAKQIENRNCFELLQRPQNNIVCFRYQLPNTDFDEHYTNNLNLNIRKEIIESGYFYIVQTEIEKKIYLRCSIMNYQTSESELTELLNTIEKIAKRLLK